MAKKLDELEMFELLRLAYPEKFKDETDETYDAAQEFADSLSGWEEIAELLGRVAELAPPMKSPLTGELYSCLGESVAAGENTTFVAVVKRPIKTQISS